MLPLEPSIWWNMVAEGVRNALWTSMWSPRRLKNNKHNLVVALDLLKEDDLADGDQTTLPAGDLNWPRSSKTL